MSSEVIRPVILRLLSNIGSAKEISQYLRRFSQLDADRFAVVKVVGGVMVVTPPVARSWAH